MSDPLDVLSLTEAKAILSVQASSTNYDTQLARVITAVSRKLDKAVGPIVRRAISAEQHQGRNFVRQRIELRWCPVTSISAVTNYLGATATLLTEATPGVNPSDGWLGERYAPDPSLYSGVIVRRAGLNPWYFGDMVTVSYTAGRYADTSSVDARFKEAAALTLRNEWRPYQQGTGTLGEFDVPQQTFPTYGIPNAVRDLLSDEWKPEIGFG